MALKSINVLLSGGLRTKSDPKLAGQGYLLEANDAYYPLGDPSPRRSPGRSIFGSLAADPVSVHHLVFPTSDLLLVRTSTGLVSAPGGETGAFLPVTTSDPLQSPSGHPVSIEFAGRYFLLDGISKTQVATDALTGVPAHGAKTTRRHGLVALTDAPGLLEVASVAGWHSPTVGVYYWYWVTEFDKPNDVESAFTGKAAPVFVSAITKGVEVSFRGQINVSATHWRIYRSTVTTGPSEGVARFSPDLATGLLVATVDIANSSYIDDATEYLQGPKYPTATHAPNEWINPTGAFADEIPPASIVTAETTGGISGQDQGYGNFAFTLSSAEEPIVGIEVEVQARRTLLRSGETAKIRVALSWDNGVTYGEERVTNELSTAYVTYTLGNPTHLWGHDPWTAAQLGNGFLVVKITSSLTMQPPAIIRVDFVRVKVYHSGAENPEETDIPFPTVVVRTLGKDVTYPSHAEPPISQMGCVFEGSLVLKSGKSELAYSLPSDPDYFPAPYRIALSVGQQEIRALASDNAMMIVGFPRGMARVNTLPKDTNFDFQTDAIWRQYTTAYGVVGHRAITQVTFPDDLRTFAFIDRWKGLCVTDGYRCRALAPGLDFDALVNPTALSRAILLDYPAWGALILYYASRDSELLNKRLAFHYGEVGADAGAFAVRPMGPLHLPVGVSATSMQRGDETTHIYLSSSLTAWVEDRGVSPGEGGIDFRVTSGEVYPRGFGNEAKVEKILVHYTGHSTLTPLKAETKQFFVGEGPHVQSSQPVITLDRGSAMLGDAGGTLSGLSVTVFSDDARTQLGISFLTVMYEDMGGADK
jgi:hypothetical protein